MSAKVQGWVWDLDLAPQPKLLLLWLANRATDAGVCFPSKREIGTRTGLSERMVRYHLEALANDRDELGKQRGPLIKIIERRVAADRNTSNVYVLCVPWAPANVVRSELDELKHIPNMALEGVGTTGCTQGGGDDALHPVGTTGCTQVGTTGCTENRSPVRSHRKIPPIPPEHRPSMQQQGGLGNRDQRTGNAGTDMRGEPVQGEGARDLANAFYEGLGASAGSVTDAIRRRDISIARQLVAAGATPAEAEAYARETSASTGRIAPVDLRSFERERLGWLARRRGADLNHRHLLDRTGQPPAWEVRSDIGQSAGAKPSVNQPALTAPAPVDATAESSGDLGAKLRDLLLRGDQQA